MAFQRKVSKVTTAFYFDKSLQAHDLAIDESSFTGESIPIYKSIDLQTDSSSKIKGSTQKNVAFMGTLVTTGHGKVSLLLILSIKM